MLGHLNERGEYNLHFEIKKNQQYDAAFFINTPKKTINLKVKEGNVICLMGEPAYKANLLFGYNLYMYKKLNQYDRVFSIIKNANNVIESQPYLGWFEDNYSYKYWKKLNNVVKSKMISCISSDKLTTSGHKKRFKFVKKIRSTNLPIDYFGRGYNELTNKHQGLRDYKYSIAIENGVFKNYFSEKIMDCFLNWTVPIYYGCPNIKKFFPENSYILIDIENFEESKNIIEEIIKNDNYEKRLEALEIARNLVLEKYNLHSLIKNNEAYIKNNLNNDWKKYKIKPITSLSNKIKYKLFPKVKKIRNFIYKKMY